ncbi:serine hydrolase domain-containing protein [Maribellus mangrovi]|uniref:serine hydrolase domain-containing protein n=1 Tax=Maribellus mangrovi TaxID=3133146 RepID=UPI0030ECD917
MMKILITIFMSILGTQFICGQNIDSILNNYYKNSSIPSCIMGYVNRDGDLNYYAFGPAILGEHGNVDADNIFRIASMTKPITSVAALQLVEKGLIGLDDPLNELLPEMSSIPILDENGNLRTSYTDITLRQLLTHTSGFAYNFTSGKLANSAKYLIGYDSIIGNITNLKIDSNWDYVDNPRIFDTGTSFRYGTSTYWVGKLVEKISNMDMENYFRENITGPLKMDHTWFNVPDNLKNKIVAWGTTDSLGNYLEHERLPKEKVTDFKGDGGLYSSVNDYLKFLQCILNDGKYEGGRILKKETVEMMLADQLPSDVSVVWEGITDYMPDYIKDFCDVSDRWCFIGAYENNPEENIRANGAVWWAGVQNTYFTIDLKNKVALVFMSQLYPTVDKERFEFYRLLEKEVYQTLK